MALPHSSVFHYAKTYVAKIGSIVGRGTVVHRADLAGRNRGDPSFTSRPGSSENSGATSRVGGRPLRAQGR